MKRICLPENSYTNELKIGLLLLPLLILLLLTNCNKDSCPNAPTNLHYTKVSYQYRGGILTSAGVTLVWDSVNYATGYNLFIKNETGQYEFEKSTTGNTIYVYQSIGGSDTYVVTAFNSECESDYSGEYTLEIEK